MPTIKKRGQSIKQHAEQDIKSIWHHIAAFIETYKKQVAIAASVVAAILVIGAGFFIMRSMQEQKAAPILAAAYEQYRPVGGTAVDYQKALAQFRDVQNKYPNTTSGAIAQFYIGNCLSNLGQTEEAIKEYRKFVKDYSGEKFLLGQVQQRLGYAYLGTKNQAEAIKAFEQADALAGPGISTLELARLYEATGKTAEAQAKYKLILEKLSGTIWAMEAMSKVPKTAAPVAPKDSK